MLGLIAAPVVSRMLLRFLGPETDLSAAIDRRVFLFALAVSVVTGALCAIAPALQIRRLSLNERAQGALAAGVGFRKMLVIGQIAFTVILLTGAGLFVQTVARLQAEAPGAASRLVMFRADPPSIGYSSPRAREFMRELARRLEGVTGVEQAAMANTSLLAGGSFSRTLTIQSDERLVTDRPVYGLSVTPGFFLDPRDSCDRRPRLRRARHPALQRTRRSAIARSSSTRVLPSGILAAAIRSGFVSASAIGAKRPPMSKSSG